MVEANVCSINFTTSSKHVEYLSDFDELLREYLPQPCKLVRTARAGPGFGPDQLVRVGLWAGPRV